MTHLHIPDGNHDSQVEDHQAIRDQLAEFAARAALGEDPEQTYPHVAAHLAGCVDCRAVLAEILALVRPAYAGEVPPAASYPNPDLSFLRPPTETEPSDH